MSFDRVAAAQSGEAILAELTEQVAARFGARVAISWLAALKWQLAKLDTAQHSKPAASWDGEDTTVPKLFVTVNRRTGDLVAMHFLAGRGRPRGHRREPRTRTVRQGTRRAPHGRRSRRPFK
jgi:hypothetical protein